MSLLSASRGPEPAQAPPHATSPGRRDSGRSERIAVLLVLTLFAVVAAASLDADIKAQQDSGVYIALARSLASGTGYADIFVVGQPPNTRYPPVFPTLLTPFIYLFGYRVVLFKLLVIAMATAALYAVYRLLLREPGDPVPLLVVVAAATSPGLLFFSQSVMSEMPYLLFSVLALLALRTYASVPTRAPRPVLTAALIALALLTRLIGLSLLLAAVVYLFVDLGRKRRDCRRGALLVLVLALIPATIWLARNLWVGEPAGAAYWSEFHPGRAFSSSPFVDGVMDLRRTVTRNLVRYSGHVGRVIFFGDPATSTRILSPVLAAVVFGGFVWCAVRRRTAIEYYAAFYMGVLLLYPATHLQRYLVPLLPFVWYYFLVAVRQLLAGILRACAVPPPAVDRPAAAVAALLAVGLALSNGVAAVSQNAVNPGSERYYRAAGDQEAYLRVLPWVRTHTRPDSVLLWAKPSLRFLASDRRSVPLPPGPDPDAQSILEGPADYVVVDAFSRLFRRCVQPVVERHPQHFRLLHETDISAVYQVVRPGRSPAALPGQPAVPAASAGLGQIPRSPWVPRGEGPRPAAMGCSYGPAGPPASWGGRQSRGSDVTVTGATEGAARAGGARLVRA